ncbi:leucine-rich repeat domain-containing protein [Mycoplasma sp. 'Moose RK']|uniref:leucine-rich repeat domain-containing protein n=1 Tax=Mycoplasma sp. 'Moose RK' TaxID=2780095 RepID=UPI0018C2060B|nr:leucine-rich repeat domain-containing protein [Mycoplasma sp. 'Moose RK']MBG0730555.1 leucine-rich repeat domain-containing protein [Mycoplasma sp. 'Moose RK']
MKKIIKLLKICTISVPLSLFLSCGQAQTQAEILLETKEKKDSSYVKINPDSSTFVLDLSTSNIEKIDKSAFSSFKSRIYQPVNSLKLSDGSENNAKMPTENNKESKKINFYYLSKIIFPPTLREIDDYAFYADSANLTSGEKITELDFSLSKKLEKIGNFAFQGNEITKLTLPESVISIGKQAFAFNKLQSVNFAKAKNLKLIATGAFFSNQISELDFSQNSSLAQISASGFESNLIQKVSFSPNSQSISLGNSSFKDNKIANESGLIGLPQGSKTEKIFI